MTAATDLALYRTENLEREVKALRAEVEAIERRNDERDKERTALERKQLLWGIMFLGSIIMTLGGVIWSYRGVIFKGVS